jgi:predicted GIY-YIG superfamily endonuclease
MLIDLRQQFRQGLSQIQWYEFRQRRGKTVETKVYLLHFDEPYKHARHYVGSAENLAVRLSEHRKGKGARLIQVIQEAGIGWRLVRVWFKGGRALEKRIKRARNHPRLCPVCNPKLTIERFINPEEI